MKKSKFLRRASIVALAAVMTAGVALGAAACGGGGGGIETNAEGYRTGTPGASKDADTLTVYIFCNTSDATTNRAICEEWMRKYNAAHNTNYKVSVSTIANKEEYFSNVDNAYANDSMYDVLYLAPRYVRTYAETGSVLNLSDYFDTVSADPALTGDEAKAANQQVLGQIWKNAASYYSYQKGKSMGDDAYILGQGVSYDSETNRFVTDAKNEPVGIYGLPKDYSNFSTGYNNNFFSETIKEAVTTLKATQSRTVKGAKNETTGSVSSERTYTAQSGYTKNAQGAPSIVQYAVTDDYTNPYTGETMHAVEGQAAPIINVGVPTRYFPFNFFRYNNYTAALQGGDPLACLCEAYTDGQGYTVTIPGFPNDTVKIPDSVAKDPNAPYDSSIGHITYTYAEYSAFIWAMTYYLNTFAWQNNDGNGGIKISGSTEYKTVFGGEQYEGKTGAAVGTVLYLLPWLYSNDADIVDLTNQYCAELNGNTPVGQGANIATPSEWRSVAAKAANDVQKMNLNGDYRTASVQYGFNSERFIETYGAFLALASDWNGNIGGDSDSDNALGGWDLFRQGRSLFYGAGSWDGATRNDSHIDVLEFGQMPTPVAESFALYSNIKGANYTMEEYSNGATTKGTGATAGVNDAQQRENKAAGKKVYSADEIAMNQALRQDKWGARMDSVGYAVNGQVTNYEGAHAWKKEAAVSLVMSLTIDRDSQISLTYAGAQYPNFRDQMEQFVNYQDYGENGAFKDMITFEGFSTTKYYDADGKVNDAGKAEAERIWGDYYNIALEMERAVTDPSLKSQTVAQFLNGKTAAGAPVKYDETYANTVLGDFAGSSGTSFLGYAMKVLRMIPMWRSTREINIRMQYGLNAVRDSTMYTYNDGWVAYIDARPDTDTMLAYTRGKTIKVAGTAINSSNLNLLVDGGLKRNPTESKQTWETPVLYCLRKTYLCQRDLFSAYDQEMSTLNRLQQK